MTAGPVRYELARAHLLRGGLFAPTTEVGAVVRWVREGTTDRPPWDERRQERTRGE